MLIQRSDLQLSSSHELDSSTSRELRLVAAPRADTAFGKVLGSRIQALSMPLLAVDGVTPAAAGTQRSPFEAVLEWLLGLSGPPSQASTDGGTGPAATVSLGVQTAVLTEHSESERCSFAASGKVCLADGSSRQFDVAYDMERSETTTTLGTAALRDPLVLDLAPPTTGLSAQSVDLDVDGDGKTESLRMPAAGSALLFDDRNHNGVVDDGSELFGARSGDGFAELAKLDGDGNGWIDSGDAAFADLKLWQVGSDGSASARSLAEAGIGALATASAATPFTLKEDGTAVGRMRASSVWLGETVGAGTVREMDLAVTEPGSRSG